MNKQLSIYLDVMRFIAAVLVFVSHVPGFAGGWLWQFAGFGHEAVVIFFVLSGFVIAYVVFERKEGPLKYSVSRLSRIYSVALPALLLTVLLYYIGNALNPDAFISLNQKLKDPLVTFISSLFFLNQSWFAYPVFSNLPYWSLGYEVLYYLFFGIIIYIGGVKRVIFLLLVLLLMGPSIILYLPVWLSGVFCYKFLASTSLGFKNAIFLFILSIVGGAFLSFDYSQQIINSFGEELIGVGFYNVLLEPAEKFLSDYFLTVMVVLHIYSAGQLLKRVRFFKGGPEKLIRSLASHTFSIYLFHMPLLFFISAICPYEVNPLINLLLCWLFVPLIVVLLSFQTENKKASYVTFFDSILRRLIFKLNLLSRQ